MPSFNSDSAIERPAFIVGENFGTKAISILKGFGNLKPGTAMGKITASGKYAPVARTTVASTAAAGQKDITVVDGTVFTAGQTIRVAQIGSTSNYEDKPIASIAGNVITMTYNLTYELSAGDLVALVDGSETAQGLLAAAVDCGVGTGDEDYLDKDNAMVVDGAVDSTKCTGLDALGRAAINAAVGGNITFPNLL